MSWSALKWASETKVGTSTDKLILIILANFTDAEDTCYPSHRKIAELAECSTDTVIRSLKRLNDLNFISTQKRFQLTKNNNQRQTSNIYKLNTPLHIATPPPLQNATPITINNKNQYCNKFEIFWKEYPSRPNDNKFGASQKFNLIIKNNEIDFDLLIEKTKLFCKSQQGKDSKFIPHAKTWLVQKRFYDIEKTSMKKTNRNFLVG
tara:strand:+ start:801 stop:1418 length:618 start_codon:yes stop_codon:yes gene_type:complete